MQHLDFDNMTLDEIAIALNLSRSPKSIYARDLSSFLHTIRDWDSTI